MNNEAIIRSFFRPNRVELLTLRRRAHREHQLCLPRNHVHIRQLDDYMSTIDFEEFCQLIPDVEGAAVEQVLVVGEDMG